MSWCQDELPDIVDSSELLRSCQSLLGSIGVTGMSHLRTDLMGSYHLQATYPKRWLSFYSDNELHEIDPVISMGQRQPNLVGWSSKECNPEDEEFFNLAHSFGVPANGAAVTFGSRIGISAFSLASDVSSNEWARTFEAHNSELNLIAMAYCIKASQLNAKVRLTPREKEVLLWAARGKTSWETSKLLDLSEGTINQYLRGAMRKLNATNRVHCVAKAVDLGLLKEFD
nr:LuxR family transcriptional regulator [uncultured Ruegeria sp.]